MIGGAARYSLNRSSHVFSTWEWTSTIAPAMSPALVNSCVVPLPTSPMRACTHGCESVFHGAALELTEAAARNSASSTVLTDRLPRRGHPVGRCMYPLLIVLPWEGTMRSAAHIKSHPIHAILVSFPIGLLVT